MKNNNGDMNYKIVMQLILKKKTSSNCKIKFKSNKIHIKKVLGELMGKKNRKFKWD